MDEMRPAVTFGANPGQLSEAVIVYVGKGFGAAPHASRERVLENFQDHAAELADYAEQVVREADVTKVDWKNETLQSAGRRVQAETKHRHPELSDDALYAVYWKWTFDWR